MNEILDIIHKTIYQFFDVCGDNEEVPISDKDKLLLEVNKAICNNLKALEQQPTTRHSCEYCKILELLVDFGLETICEDDDKDFEYCENNCNFNAPTKECYLHWAEHKRKAVSE